MKRFSRKFFLELASIVFTCLVLVLGFAWWRLEHGPADVGFLRPFAEAEFLKRTGLHLKIDGMRFGAQGWRSPVEIDLAGITIADDAGAAIATAEQAEGTLSLRALLTGSVKPITLLVTTPRIVVTHDADGSYHPHLSAQPQKKSNAPPDLAALADPKPQSDMEFWNKIAIVDGSMVLNDGQGHDLARVDDLSVQIRRTPLGLEGTLHGTPKAGEQSGEMTAAIDCTRGAKGTIVLHSTALRADAFAFAEPFLAQMLLPLSATITARLDGTKVDAVDVDLGLQAGQVVDPEHFRQPVPVSGGTMKASYQTAPERLELRKLEIDLEGPVISATGEARTTDGTLSFNTDVLVTNVKLDSFDSLWPLGVSKGGRLWVTSSLSKGLVTKATAHVEGKAPRNDPSQADISTVTGTIAVTGSAIHYFGELPAVQDADASIIYDMDSMTVTMLGGHAENLNLTGGTVVLSGFSKPDQAINIDITLSGPVATALDIIDHKPLQYARKLQLDPKRMAGTADTNLKMSFPLLAELPLDQIVIDVTSILHDVSLPNVVGHLAANGLNGRLSVGAGGMEFQGGGLLGDVPLAVDYKQSFAANGATEVTFSGTADEAQRAELGVGFPERLKGSIGLSGHYTSQAGKGTADITADLMQGRLLIDEIGYEKPPGEPGTMKVGLQTRGGKLTTIDPLSIEAPALAIAGSAQLDPDTGKLVSASLSKFTMDRTDMQVGVAPLDGGGSRITVSGSEFDARRFLHKRRQKVKEASAAVEETPVPLEIDVDLAAVKTADNAGLAAVKGQLVLLGRKWRKADFSAQAGGAALSLAYLPDSDAEKPSYTLHAAAADAGAALAGFALTSSIKGGTLTVYGKKPAATDAQPDPVLEGSLHVTAFRVTNPPVFARLFNLLSVRGVAQSMDSPDIQFDSLDGNFGIDKNQLRINEGRLEGAAIGLTMAGTVDRDADTLDLYGTVVPANGANQIINSIPVLGPLITGGDGEGIFAATYTINGAVENPDVALNPLSIFAPGVLRHLLFSRSEPDTGAAEKGK